GGAMPGSLAGRRVLVAEDLYLVAMMVCETITAGGGEVVGPYPSCEAAFAGLKEHRVDAAVLDIGLSDGYVFPLARRLRQQGTPFLFLSGYDLSILPDEFAGVPCLLKPYDNDDLCSEVASLLRSPAHAGAAPL
ncbi:MAG TPA: hypothetical protein VFV70_01300, partial [Hyphomonadaceae bacterium]|nr:hypothetical protein [Hyphomonadaceae bacterium]